MSLQVSLGARFGDFHLEVEFRAPEGITALFGPSGAGKTMTLRCIAGLERPRSGRIVLNGKRIFDAAGGVDLPARLRRVGYVFQDYALLPHLTVAANVGYGLHGWEPEARSPRVRELLALVGLPEHGSRRPGGLSGGEQQRVALARALAPRPDLLLLDEPFAALDRPVRRRLRAELLEVQAATGTPMVLVTHDLAEVRETAGWLVVYDAGRVLREGPTGEVLAAPGSPDAARILSGEE